MSTSKAAGSSLRGCCSRLPARLAPVRPCLRPAAATSPSDANRAAAALFVDTYVRDGQTLGLGSGELASLAIAEVARRLDAGQLSGVRGVPASTAAASEAAFHGLPLHTDDSAVSIDLAFETVDGCIDLAANAAILGVTAEPRQPQLFKALVMAQQRAQRLVLLAEQSKVVPRLRGALPVLIEHEGWEEAAEAVDDLVIGDAEVWRRAVPGSLNPTPRGGDAPYVSEEGHNILDLKYGGELRLFDDTSAPYERIEDELMQLPGVVATGLLLGVAVGVVIAGPDGPKVLDLQRDPAVTATAASATAAQVSQGPSQE